MQPLNDKIKAISQGVTGELVLDCLDEVINYMADARNGAWSIESRLVSIEALKEVLYNKIKSNRTKPNQNEIGSDDMI